MSASQDQRNNNEISTTVQQAGNSDNSVNSFVNCNHHHCFCHHHNHHHHHNHGHSHYHQNTLNNHHQQQQQQQAQPQQPNSNNNEPNLELHQPGQHHIPISHQYIAIKNTNSTINNSQTDLIQSTNLERNSRFISGDESYPSGSDDSETRKKRDETRKIINNRLDDHKFANRIEVYSDGADSGVKVTDDATSEDDQGPPLPPRPPPRPRNFTLDDICKSI